MNQIIYILAVIVWIGCYSIAPSALDKSISNQDNVNYQRQFESGK